MDNKAIVTKLLDAVWSKGQLAVIDELIGRDFVGYWPLRPEPIRGPTEYKEFVTDLRRIFPDQTIKVLDVIGEGERVVTRFEVTGTQRGEFLSIPPTNKTQTVEGISISRIAKGKIVETRVQMDTLTVLHALGIVSPNIAMHAHAVAR